MRAARGSAFVRRTVRFDPGYRLHVFVAQRQRHQSEGLASERSNRSEDTQAAAHGCGPAPVKRAVRVGTERRLRWAVGELADPLGFGPRASRSESWAPSSCLPDRRPSVLGMDWLPGSAPGAGSTLGCGTGSPKGKPRNKDET